MTAYDKNNQILHTEDPKIIFDDVHLDGGPGRLHAPDAESIARAAEQAWEKLFEKLNTVKNREGESAIKFYPHGVNDIEVTVAVSGVTVTVKVSGPNS